ncbi:hypothetical protein [Haliscomenobacter sp.]|uniref:hypothetical protein n=1 Tax=Haliscomenobacter sp. TaxID=2717303 RepID=UPI003BAD8E34
MDSSELLVQELRRFLDAQLKTREDMEHLNKEVKRLTKAVEVLEKKYNDACALPDWLDAQTAMKILNIKDVDTLRTYAKRGLITQQRACDRRNYYPKSEVMSLPSRLVMEVQ